MFEDSMMESSNQIHTRSRYWSLLTLLLNGGLVGVLVLWPLLHPEALPRQIMTQLLVAPAPPPPAPPALVQARVRVPSQTLASALLAPSTIPHAIKMVTETAAPTMSGVTGMVGIAEDGAIGVLGSIGTGRTPVVTVAPQKVNVSSGVMAGNLLEKVLPQYPSVARAARIQGTVVLEATIAKDGTIQNLRVLSGPAVLQTAAVNAVGSWRYKPYLLNGAPVAVETTVNVVFSLGE